MSDTIFKKIVNTSNPIINRDREHLLNKQQAYELNTYATWGEVHPAYDLDDNYVIVDGKKQYIGPNTSKTLGVKSIFNKYTTVFKSDDIRIGDNVPLIDTPSIRNDIKLNSDCSIRNLVKCSKEGILGSNTYDYSDFAYCKYLGKMPNNYMITLRRFPIAISDHISPAGINKSGANNFGNPGEKGSYAPPISIGCLITWMGTPGNELENILKYDYSMPFKSLTAELQDNNLSPDSNKTPLSSFFAAFDPKYQQQVKDGMAGNAISNLFSGRIKEGAERPPYAEFLTYKDSNKVYGPVDVIKDTHIRSDEGLQFNHDFTLQFDYELRAYNNINTRQAMLDLLANILAVTYTSGDFWGGGYRSTGAHQSDIFTNLRIFQQNNTITEFRESLWGDVKSLLSQTKSYIEKNGGYIETAKDLFNSFGGMVIGSLLNKFGRPQKNALNSLLSPAPVGYWHVTVGNPFHPIMSIGNMILTKTTITHTGPLGLDDFPTGLRVTCELKRAKGRDKRDIEKLYMHGINRIYSHMGNQIDELYKNAPEYKGSSKSMSSTQVDSETQRGITQDNISTTGELKSNLNVEMKHFGTNFKDAILLTSGEISYGSQSKKKPTTQGQPKEYT